MLKIKNLTLASDVILAPMAGVTDLPFRRICVELGCKNTTSEMISARAMHYQDKKTVTLLPKHKTEKCFTVQIFGNEPEIMAEAAKRISDMGIADILDINMGCPAPKIVKNGDGSALMLDELKASKVISAVRNATNLPLTVKFRSGWDAEHINAISFAKMAQESGADAVTVHGRTREQFYADKADWDIVKQIKSVLDIPVILSGDIWDKQAIEKAKTETKCDGVMVARGAQGNPFIFSDKVFSQNEVLETAIRHLAYIVEHKSESIAVREARKHMCWYIKGMYGAAQAKVAINACNTQAEMENALLQLRN